MISPKYVLAKRQIAFGRIELKHLVYMFGIQLLLVGEICTYVWMTHQFCDALTLVFIMLEALTNKRNGLKSKIGLNYFSEIIIALFNFAFEFLSVFRMERCQTI